MDIGSPCDASVSHECVNQVKIQMAHNIGCNGSPSEWSISHDYQSQFKEQPMNHIINKWICDASVSLNSHEIQYQIQKHHTLIG